jgi:hypothetical protein
MGKIMYLLILVHKLETQTSITNVGCSCRHQSLFLDSSCRTHPDLVHAITRMNLEPSSFRLNFNPAQSEPCEKPLSDNNSTAIKNIFFINKILVIKWLVNKVPNCYFIVKKIFDILCKLL